MLRRSWKIDLSCLVKPWPPSPDKSGKKGSGACGIGPTGQTECGLLRIVLTLLV